MVCFQRMNGRSGRSPSFWPHKIHLILNGLNAPGQEPVESTLDRLLLGTKSRARLGLGRVIGSAEFDNDATLR